MRVLARMGLRLEPQVAAHAAGLYEVIADPALYAFIDDKEPESEAALRKRLAFLEGRTSPDGTEHWLNWVVRNQQGEIAGYVQATVSDGSAEIAYVLGRAYWRRGYGSAAVTAMLDELRDRYGVVRATATLDPANAASLALLRKLGFGLVAEMPERNEVRYARVLAGDS